MTATPEIDGVRAFGKGGERLEAFGHRRVVRPDGAVAELLAAGGEGRRDLGVEPGSDAEAA